MAIISSSPEEPVKIAQLLKTQLKPNAVVAFLGELGAGKTTFIKGLAGPFAQSPTFTYLNVYAEKVPIYHFDLYRLKDWAAFTQMGFDEYFDLGGICLIEWAEKIKSFLPAHTLIVKITHLTDQQRQIEYVQKN